jgi:hypothetical protein
MTDRSFAPLDRASTPATPVVSPRRHQSTTGPAFQLPGADWHRQATTSLQLTIKHLHSMISLHSYYGVGVGVGEGELFGSTCRVMTLPLYVIS